MIPLKRVFPFESGSSEETISNQIHDVSSPFSVEIGTEITVTCDYTGDDDCWAEMNDLYFKMTNASGVCTGTIATSTVRSGGPFTITIHAPIAESQDCFNPITITAATEQTNPFELIKDAIEDNVVVDGDSITMNKGWYEVSRRKQRQAFFDTTRRHYIEWEEITLPRNATSSRKIHHIFVGIAGKGHNDIEVSRSDRWSFECDMRRVFSDPAIIMEPADDVSYIVINDFAYSILEGDRDKKVGCEEYYAIFDIIVVYAK